MSWKVIKRELFVSIEGREREKCTGFLFQECKKFDVAECGDYWSACWDKFRVKVFNKVLYEGDRYHSAEYVYDLYTMKQLLIIALSLWSLVVILILNL